MEKFLSKDYLAEYKEQETRYFSVLNEAKEIRSRSKYSFEVSVFLSHKHDEIEILEKVIVILEKLGVDVYVDWLDEGMPKTTSGVTARKIKSKITDSDKFILIATEKAINSKWCNWELGFGDAKKYPNNIAIIPVTDRKNSDWSGSEYLQIYPVITTDRLYSIGDYFVEFQGEKQSLSDWLKK